MERRSSSGSERTISDSSKQKRKREEGTTSTGFASGPAGRRETRFRPLPESRPAPYQSQEQYERHEIVSEVPASQQVGVEYLLTLRNQLQETHHRSQAVLEGLDQHIAQMQQQAGLSEKPVSTSHDGYYQQDTRSLQASSHAPARNEQRILQHQQEEVFDIGDYLVDSPSDSDHESDQRDFVETRGPKGVAPILSSTYHSSDAQLQKYPLDNLRQKGKIEQQQDAIVQQHEVYDQASPSHQGDAQLDTEDSKILEHYTECILNDEKWNNFTNSLEIGQKEFFSGLVSNFPMETIQQAEQVRKYQQDAGPSDHLRPKDQVEQGQGTLPRQSEVPHQAGQTDMIGLMKQIENAPLTWKRRRERLEHLVQSYQPSEAHDPAGQSNMIILMKHIENLTELTWKQRREMLEGWIRYSQPHEQGQTIPPQRHEGQDQAGPSRHGDTQHESTAKQERTWPTEELHQLVDEMVQIKDFDRKTFQDLLSDGPKAICEQLNKYGRGLNEQEWTDIRTNFKEYNVLHNDKRCQYLYARTENGRKLQKKRENAANVAAQQQGFKNRYERYKEQYLKDAPKPS